MLLIYIFKISEDINTRRGSPQQSIRVVAADGRLSAADTPVRK